MRLLIIEDERRIAGLVAQALRQAGFAVDALATLAAAEAALLTTVYDAAVLDLGLPDGDGLQLLPRTCTSVLALVLVCGSVTVLAARFHMQ
jgi:DNA-binding response OmpR family regulator